MARLITSHIPDVVYFATNDKDNDVTAISLMYRKAGGKVTGFANTISKYLHHLQVRRPVAARKSASDLMWKSYL